ncbi:hypothetical protein BH11BAC5_BH11BAC5_41540 [soil metagenome]
MQETIFISLPLSELKTIIFNSVNACLDLRTPHNKLLYQDEALINIEEAAEFVNLSTASIYKLVSSNKIPFTKKHRRLLFERKELTAWLSTGRKLTLGEIERQSQKEPAG